MNESNVEYVMNNVMCAIVAPFMQYCEVYYEHELVSSYETDEYSHIDDVIDDYLIALNDLDSCVNKEDFAISKAIIKRLRERNFEMTESLFSDVEDKLLIILTKEEIECYF